MMIIKVGDSIALTWEGSDQREVDEVVAVGGGAVELKRNGYIRDDLPTWPSESEQAVYEECARIADDYATSQGAIENGFKSASIQIAAALRQRAASWSYCYGRFSGS